MQNFKALDEVMLPDPRSVAYVTRDTEIGGFRTIELRDAYFRLSRLNLSVGVPEEVQTAFVRAKHASLYSWYAFDLHPVADMAAFAALEMALRIRVTLHRGQSLTRQEKKLSELLQYSVRNELVTNHGFDRVRRIARARAAQKKTIELISAHPDADEIAIPEPTEDEIRHEIDASSYASQLCQSIPFRRNDLAHGSSAIYDGSAGTLEIVSEIINQLFYKLYSD